MRLYPFGDQIIKTTKGIEIPQETHDRGGGVLDGHLVFWEESSHSSEHLQDRLDWRLIRLGLYLGWVAQLYRALDFYLNLNLMPGPKYRLGWVGVVTVLPDLFGLESER